jgi:alkanesulfonate monooxygenase SsuD/methylene tetrahydromethanopterin reductase-like flavin-dependent oxidoreductase (luciferase family)
MGVDSLWVADEPGFWECWTILTAVAEATSRIEVGPLVACTRYRNPALLATMVRALDEVSDGRVVLGLGAGSGPSDKRWPAFGFDATAHVSRFAEAVEIIKRLLREPTLSFAGQFYTIDDPKLGPAGSRAGGPPIWVAAGKARTMAIATQFGDAVNVNSALTGAASVAAFRPALDAACAETGRDPATLPVTGWVRLAPSPDGALDADRADTIAGTPAQIAARLAEIHTAGVSHITCFLGDEDDGHQYPALTRRSLERFAAVTEALRAL